MYCQIFRLSLCINIYELLKDYFVPIKIKTSCLDKYMTCLPMLDELASQMSLITKITMHLIVLICLRKINITLS